jgi:hypothetical protein
VSGSQNRRSLALFHVAQILVDTANGHARGGQQVEGSGTAGGMPVIKRHGLQVIWLVPSDIITNPLRSLPERKLTGTVAEPRRITKEFTTSLILRSTKLHDF